MCGKSIEIPLVPSKWSYTTKAVRAELRVCSGISGIPATVTGRKLILELPLFFPLPYYLHFS